MTRRISTLIFIAAWAALTGCGGAPIHHGGSQITADTNDRGNHAFRTGDGREVSLEIIKDKADPGDRLYHIGAGDELELLLEDNDPVKSEPNYYIDINQEKFGGVQYNQYRTVVDPMGNINVPLIGQVHVAGFSVPKVEQDVKQKLTVFIVAPKIYVRVLSYASYSIYVMGEVSHPGRYEIKKPITLSEAIALGGGITRDGSFEKIFVGRPGVDTRRINLKEIWTAGKLNQELILEGGDVVYVARRLLFDLPELEQLSNIVSNITDVYFKWK